MNPYHSVLVSLRDFCQLPDVRLYQLRSPFSENPKYLRSFHAHFVVRIRKKPRKNVHIIRIYLRRIHRDIF